ncbi:hypothetical protein WCLP8_1680001 [uncultured Gammaproteobacteria bacterium]
MREPLGRAAHGGEQAVAPTGLVVHDDEQAGPSVAPTEPQAAPVEQAGLMSVFDAISMVLQVSMPSTAMSSSGPRCTEKA